MSLETRIHLGLTATQRNSAGKVAGVGDYAFDLNVLLHNGTGVGNADVLFAEARTIAASGTYSMDLVGALADLFAATVNLVKVKALLIKADPANVNNVMVGGAGANGFVSWVGDATDKVAVRPGAGLLLVAGQADTGYAATAATADLLLFTNGGAGTGVTYEVALIGSSA